MDPATTVATHFLSSLTPFSQQQENNEEEENNDDRQRKRFFPHRKKRVYCFSIVLVVVTFLMFCVNSIINFTSKLSENEQLWKFLQELHIERNASKVCSICPTISLCSKDDA